MIFLEQTTLGELYSHLLENSNDKDELARNIVKAASFYNLSDRDVDYLKGFRIALDEQSNAATLANNRHAQRIISKYKGK